MPLHSVILGAGAGGGLPQWNCGCKNCTDARAGKIPRMTQSSLAVSGNGTEWVLLNASPDLCAQLASTPELAPAELRGTPIAAVVLTDGDLDHITGLLSLRERTGFRIYATDAILKILEENAIFDVLRPELVPRRAMALDEAFDIAGVTLQVFPVPGKVALYMEGDTVVTDEVGQSVIGVQVSADDRSLLYVPSCAALTDELAARIGTADVLMFDGTVWEDKEMPNLGVGPKSGSRMGHLPIAGPRGSLSHITAADVEKIYVHINNTNPILQPTSAERAAVEAAGWTVGWDGMTLRL